MIRELDTRFFEQAERPSNTRCVQLWMSKQYPAEKWIPEQWRTLAKALYLTMLRDAAGPSFAAADMRGAVLTDSVMPDASFARADLTGVRHLARHPSSPV